VPNLRTANYSVEARTRLGDAVAQARRAAGYDSRPKFVAEFVEEFDVRIRSLEAVEAHEPTVGVVVLERIGRALGRLYRDWNVDTPRVILEGGPIPSHEPARRVTLDIRWAAREELTTLLESGVEAITYSRKLNHWRDRFADAGYSEKDLLEVSRQAENDIQEQAEKNEPQAPGLG
jgi:hypothetical protein